MSDLAPGRALEKEVADFLRSGGFRTKVNARAARPRQTDLYAQADGIDFLIEVKNRRRKVDVSDVDAIRSRLRRTAADVVGVMFTTSGVSRGAIKEIESDRTREVLVVREDEIRLLRRGRVNLRPLLERKRQELRVNGRAYFGPVATADYLDVQLPRSSYEFGSKGKSRPYFASRTGFAHAAFAMEIPEPGWGKGGGDGVTLPLRLTLSTVEDLRDILGCVHETFGLSNKGSFHIRQSDTYWQGAGAEELIDAVSAWRTRYSEAACKQPHHSEDISYLDRLRDGWVMLTTRQRVHARNRPGDRDSYLHDSHLAISLPGVPLDSRPFLDLCRYTGNDWGKFEVIAESYCRNKRLKRRLALKVVGKMLETLDVDGSRTDRTVVGVIAKNPFYRKKSLPRELKDATVSMHDLLAMELLLCDVRDWHDEGDVIDAYMLEGFETTHTPGGQVIRPFGTWNRILKRARTRKEELAELSAEAEAVIRALEESER